MDTFELHIANVGFVGAYSTKSAAIREARQWFKKSGRADRVGSFVFSTAHDRIVHEWRA